MSMWFQIAFSVVLVCWHGFFFLAAAGIVEHNNNKIRVYLEGKRRLAPWAVYAQVAASLSSVFWVSYLIFG